MTVASSAGRSGTASAHKVASSTSMRVMARAGMAAHGAVYVLLGVLALALAFGGDNHETDQRGAFEELAGNAAGWVLLLVIAVGLSAYALWRFAEAAVGVLGEEHGDQLMQRLQSAARGLAYAVLAYSAFSVIAGSNSSSQSKQQQEWTATLMRHTGGRWLVGLLGVGVVIAGIAFVVYGVRAKFEKHFPMSSMSPAAQQMTRVTGRAGMIARGVVVGLVGVLFVVAAVNFDPQKARGIDGALRQTRDAPTGPYLLALVAIGLVLFGVYGFCEARWRKL